MSIKGRTVQGKLGKWVGQMSYTL